VIFTKLHIDTQLLGCAEISTSLVSIVVSIPACHAGDPGSIPGLGVFLLFLPKKVLAKPFAEEAKKVLAKDHERHGTPF
jgi:hypothetical protein